MLPANELREIKAEIVGEEHSVNRAQKKRSAPAPPASEKSPEVAKGGTYPAVEAALHGHGGGEFGGNQRDRNAPEKRQHQNVEQRHPWAGGGDHVFQSEGTASGVGKHHPDEVEEAGFVKDRFRRGGSGRQRTVPRGIANEDNIPG